jgi:predicted RNase H-like HicB family nuclease
MLELARGALTGEQAIRPKEGVNAMSGYSVTIDHDEEDVFLAWVHELPGCHAHGRTREEALANVTPAIERFRDWLREIGDTVDQEPVTVRLVEAAGAVGRTSQGPSGVLLTSDRGAFTREHWDRVERWLDHSRKEILGILEGMDDQDLETAAHKDARSIAKQLRHLATAEYMYTLWTFDFTSRRDLQELLDWTRRMASDRLRTLADRGDARLTKAEWSGDDDPEPWTARKAARKLVYHEGWHLKSIRRLRQRLGTGEAPGGPP